MTTARDVMTTDTEVLDADDTARSAAERMAGLDIGALPICGPDRKLVGVVTDRDIVTQVVARGEDPASVRVGSLAQGEAVTIGADDSLDEARRTMAEHQVKRLPVIDGDRLVGIVSLADVAGTGEDAQTGDTVEGITS